MSKVQFKLNSAGVREMLRSNGTANACREHANKVAGRCGSGYEVSTYIGTKRANASVMAVTEEAIRENYENNTLEKALY
jgi:hypothetical protein